MRLSLAGPLIDEIEETTMLDPAKLPQLAVLKQLHIASPCHYDWERMTGTERERHCESCNKSVHNLIELSADEAVRLVTEPDAHLCVRIHRDGAGNVVTKDSPDVADLGRRSMLHRFALAAASWFGLTVAKGCSRLVPTSGEAQVLMGDVCPPAQSGSAGGSSRGGSRSVVSGKLKRPPQTLPSPIEPSQSAPKPNASPSASLKSSLAK